jgi:hypothetical protein
MNDSPPIAALSPAEGVTLAPRFWVPLGAAGLGAGCLLLLPLWSGARWLALAVVLLALFLAVQTALLRLRFTPTDLLVLRADTEIRRFPYRAWQGWRIFWPALPVLFYFREEHSIHLLPMLFDATALREQLQEHIGAPPTP